jgi:hypothetical protein
MKLPIFRIGLVGAIGLATQSVACIGQVAAPSANSASVKVRSPGTRITGIVFDSLHSGRLANAEVLAEGGTVTIGHTDETGTFNIAGVAPGRYHLAVSHPLLDTLGLSLVTPDFTVVADSVSFVRMAVPSATALIDLRCGRSADSTPASAIIGRVVSGDSFEPVPKVEVTVNWTTYTVSAIGGVEKSPRVERDSTARNGAYKICGLPNDLQADLEARLAGKLISASQVAVPDSGVTLLIRNFVIAPDSNARSAELPETPGTTASNNAVHTLAAVTVTASARERALDQIGFTQRSQHSVGHFLTADQIAGMSDFHFTDLLRGIPGIRVGIDKHGDDVVTSPRAGGSVLNETLGCVQYFVDGQQWGNGALEALGTNGDTGIAKMRAQIAIETARQINASLQKSDIIGIEVYQGGGAPAYFNQGGHNCAIIAVWTIASVSR